jgi:hypothetical protein
VHLSGAWIQRSPKWKAIDVAESFRIAAPWDHQVVKVDEFDTEDSALRDEMPIIITVTDADGGTDLDAVHEGLPPSASAADNDLGWR